MTLMISVSGMRGIVGTDLTPELVARQAAALGAWTRAAGNPRVVLGRDARTSGEMFAHAATAGLLSVGCDVIELGLVPTPTVQLAVVHHKAGAGLILTASHNPVEWNALKLVGPAGIFLDAEAGGRIRALAEEGPRRSGWDGVGSVSQDSGAIARHLEQVLALPEVDTPLIRRAGFTVALDCVRGAGGAIIPELLERLGCTTVGIHLETDGHFPHQPEPIPENLGELAQLVRRAQAHVGMAVDPDVDRLALVDEQGVPIGEDYTLAFAVRAVLGSAADHPAAPTAAPAAAPPHRRTAAPVVVANLSTSLVVEDAARECGATFVRAPVGEANVARAMLQEAAPIGGEGNGGVMLTSLHLGRDAPLGVALILQYLATQERPVSRLVAAAPRYRIVKAKTKRGADLAKAYTALKERFPEAVADQQDGLRLGWADRWVHLRPSGTEPVIRMIAEAPTQPEAEALIDACRSLL
ncbi:MAG TPA: phosphoglucosamine mutase [Gemmatimonadales bacterium]|jgi:phosphomannomutase|nr:phosphoglucosamine mutase [Gemmatimonadales bacterium]